MNFLGTDIDFNLKIRQQAMLEAGQDWWGIAVAVLSAYFILSETFKVKCSDEQ